MTPDQRNDSQSSPTIRWTTLALIALILGVLGTFELRLAYGRRLPLVSIERSIAMAVPRWLVIIPFAPLITWAMRRFPFDRWREWRPVGVHVALACVFTLAQATAYTAFFRAFSPWPMTTGVVENFFRNLAWAAPSGLLSYAAIVGVAYAAEQARRRREREVHAAVLAAQLSEARLGALRAQLNPHFLFNTLNSLAALVSDRDTPRALGAVEHLGDLLRYVLRDDSQRDVPLAEEIEFITRYLAIEQVRFEDRLRPEIAVDADVREALVPSLILQPVVENAIRHGVARRSSAGRITVRASRRGERVVLRVEDDGPGPTSSHPLGAKAGVGLANTRARLRELYGDQASFELTRDASGTVAEIVLPFRARPPERAGAAFAEPLRAGVAT